jgi:hypothetical protein
MEVSSSATIIPAKSDQNLSDSAIYRLTMLALGLAVTLLASCSTQADTSRPELIALGQQFLLADEPAGATGILDYRESKSEQSEVTLLGRIGGGKPTWSIDSAMFLLSDPTEIIADESHHECHDDNCPFCKGKARPDDSKAIVILTGADGQVPPIDARKLLPLAEGQMVVVSGRAEINSLGQLVVHARGLYLRR